MALPEITAPDGTPVFLAEGHRQNDDSAFAQIDYATGHSRSRRVKSRPERVVSVRWFLEAPLVPVVREWIEETLLQASLPFAANIANLGPGLVAVGARWISYQWEMLHLGRAILSGELLVEDVDEPVVTLSIGWNDPIDSESGSVAHENAGAATFELDPQGVGGGPVYVASVVGYAGGVVVWSLDWTPTGSDPAPTISAQSGGWVRIAYAPLAGGGFGSTSAGLLRITATVDGAPTDAILMASGEGNYASMAWGPEP